jgi:hypothetical protein
MALREQMIKLAKDNPELRKHLVPILKEAMEFPTQKALKKYLDDHPDADKSKHKVVETKKEKVEKPQKKRKSIYDDTPIIPYVVADTVVSDMVNKLSDKETEEISKLFDDTYTDNLADRVEKMYKKDDTFAKKVLSERGTVGRDFVYQTMKKLLLEDLGKKNPELRKKIPDSFVKGEAYTK